MPRKSLQRNSSVPYHVTARVNNRDDFHVDLGTMWKIMGSECLTLSLIFGVEFHALVLMPNHFHILLTVPEHDLGIVMNMFMSNVTRISNKMSGRSGHLFGGAYHWSVVNSSRYFGHALKYVYRNPVKAKLCERVEYYPYSTLYGLLGLAQLLFPIHLTRVGMEIVLPSIDAYDLIGWLNTPFSSEAEELIQKGLRKRLFDKLLSRNTRRSHELLDVFL